MKQNDRSARIALPLVLSALLLVPAAAAEAQDATSDWASVRRAEGHAVTVTKYSGEAIEAVLAMADQSRVVLVTPGGVVSTPEWRRLLRRAESRWDRVAMGTERVTGPGGREISRDGLFRRGERVATWTSVARGDVFALSGRWRKQGRALGLIIGTAVGLGVAIPLAAVGAIMGNEGGNASGAYALAVTAPIVGASAGYFLMSHEETLLYRVATPAMPLDDETWRRIRAALPASLRGHQRAQSTNDERQR